MVSPLGLSLLGSRFSKACVRAVEQKSKFPNISPTSGSELKKGEIKDTLFFADIFEGSKVDR